MSMNQLARHLRRGRALDFQQNLEELEAAGEAPTLEGETFKELTLDGFVLRGINLTNVEFETCELRQVRLEGCTLDGTYMHDTKLDDCDLSGCSGQGFALEACTIDRSRLDSLELEGAEWTTTTFLDCELKALTFAEALLEELTFQGGRFERVEVTDGELSFITLRESQYAGQLELVDCTTNRCYVADDSTQDPPEGFARKSGRRRTL